MVTITSKRYSELIQFETFEERFEYLNLLGVVGNETFGKERHLNQSFYTSREWRDVRHHVIARDNGNDLGIPGREIRIGLVIHHINPMTPDDIYHRADWILDPEFLITTQHETHNAIHYGNASTLRQDYTPRRPGDTASW